MSFLDSYLSKYKLDAIPDSVKTSLSKVETNLKQMVSDANNTTFDDAVKQFGPQVADLIERFSNYFASLNGWSFSKISESLRFVIGLATEVFHIVENVKDVIIKPEMTDTEKHSAKVDFGKQLVYFIWITVDPFKDKFNWLPFKNTIEKNLVLWIADMALQHTVDLFSISNKNQINLMSSGYMKVFP